MTSYRLLIGLLTALLIGLQAKLWHGEGGLNHLSSLKAKANQLAEANESSRQRNAVLRAENNDLEHGLDAIEEIARSELGLIKKGETFFLVLED